jgi:hypothetical protein
VIVNPIMLTRHPQGGQGKGCKVSVSRLAVQGNVQSNLKGWLSNETTQGCPRQKVNSNIQDAWKALNDAVRHFHMAYGDERLVGSRFMNDLESRRTNGHHVRVPVRRSTRKLPWQASFGSRLRRVTDWTSMRLFDLTFKPHYPPNHCCC